MHAVLYLANDNLIELDELFDAITGAYVNNASVTLRLTKAGVDVAGETWPLAMNYVASSNGRYRAVAKGTLVLTAFEEVNALVQVVTTSGAVGEWNGRLHVRERGRE